MRRVVYGRAATDGRLLTDDFKEFLKLLNAHHVEYLLVGGYAVGLHGYPRATVGLDVWVRATTPDNAVRTVQALRAFGFDLPALEPLLFVEWPAPAPARSNQASLALPQRSVCVLTGST